VEENKEPTTSSDEVEAHALERAPNEGPTEDLLKDDEPDVEGHAFLERSPTESPTETPTERAPTERPMD